MVSVSIIIATRNRAEILKETFDSMKGVDRSGIKAEWIVIDNGSSDETERVIQSLGDELPLRFLRESIPGKNRALNRALREVQLGDVVVFTDDDTSPRWDWLQEICGACRRWANHSVFGGRIIARWPGGVCPKWMKNPWLLSFGVSEHNFGERESPYSSGTYPFGPNFWVRKGIFADGRLFPEEMGPIGRSRIMGSETSFLVPLAKEGYEMIYCPKAVVEHRVKRTDCRRRVLFRRAYSLGRGTARVGDMYKEALLLDRPATWYTRATIRLSIAFLKLIGYLLYTGNQDRMENICHAGFCIGQVMESIRISSTQTKR